MILFDKDDYGKKGIINIDHHYVSFPYGLHSGPATPLSIKEQSVFK